MCNKDIQGGGGGGGGGVDFEIFHCVLRVRFSNGRIKIYIYLILCLIGVLLLVYVFN